MVGGSRFPDAVAMFALLLHLALATFVYGSLPNAIPAGFDALGNVRGFGPKWTLWLVVGGAVLIYVLTIVAARFPLKYVNLPVTITDSNREQVVGLMRDMLSWTKMWVMLVFFALTMMILRAARMHQSQLTATLILYGLTLCLLASIALFTIRMRRTV